MNGQRPDTVPATRTRERSMKNSIVAALGLSLLASSASAQGMRGQNQPPDQWVMNCNTEQGRDCTVSAMIDGGPDNLLGTFLIVSYSVAYTHAHRRGRRLGPEGQHAGRRSGPWSRRPSAPAANVPTSRAGRVELLQEMLRRVATSPSRPRRSDDGMARAARASHLSGFAAQYQRAVEAQQGR